MEELRVREKQWFIQYDNLKAFLEETGFDAPTETNDPQLHEWLSDCRTE